MGNSEPSSEAESVLKTLANRRRQYVIETLYYQSNPKPVRELATEIAARERSTPERDVGEDAVEQVHVALYHLHLPMLEDAGLVSLDDDHVVATETIHLAKRLLDAMSEA